ncbi:MAG TPA: DoxX family protein [Steroidobacteraceae bacterium]
MLTSTAQHLPAESGGIARLLQIANGALARLADPFAFATRLYVSWQFLKSGYIKVSSWDTTLSLFRDEYHVPLLPPDLAAVVGTFGELCFPVLVILGLFGRLSAAGLFAVNAMAVISYAHVLLAEGYEAALGQHVLWGYMLVMLAIHGPGAWSLDRLLGARVGATRG